MQLDPKFNKRRKWAAISFYTIIATIFLCFGAVFFGDEHTASRLQQAGVIMASVIVCLTANVSHYMQLVSNNDDAAKA